MLLNSLEHAAELEQFDDDQLMIISNTYRQQIDAPFTEQRNLRQTSKSNQNTIENTMSRTFHRYISKTSSQNKKSPHKIEIRSTRSNRTSKESIDAVKSSLEESKGDMSEKNLKFEIVSPS